MNFSININQLANQKYFNLHLKNNYIIDSIIYSNNEVLISAQITDLQKNEIINYYNNITESDWLDFYKSQKFELINEKTEYLISLGYTYNGLKFSLSEKAQTNILALYSTKDDNVLTFPISWNTIDDLQFFNITDSQTIANIYYTALATKKNCLESGTFLKNQIRLAQTVAEVDLINDNR